MFEPWNDQSGHPEISGQLAPFRPLWSRSFPKNCLVPPTQWRDEKTSEDLSDSFVTLHCFQSIKYAHEWRQKFCNVPFILEIKLMSPGCRYHNTSNWTRDIIWSFSWLESKLDTRCGALRFRYTSNNPSYMDRSARFTNATGFIPIWWQSKPKCQSMLFDCYSWAKSKAGVKGWINFKVVFLQ